MFKQSLAKFCPALPSLQRAACMMTAPTLVNCNNLTWFSLFPRVVKPWHGEACSKPMCSHVAAAAEGWAPHV